METERVILDWCSVCERRDPPCGWATYSTGRRVVITSPFSGLLCLTCAGTRLETVNAPDRRATIGGH